MRRLAFLGAWIVLALIVAWYPPANDARFPEPTAGYPVTLVTPGPLEVPYHPSDDLAHYRPGLAPQR